ncbi:MAG: glycine betaine ABC transporter substrate-binding protein [Pseudomonadota bacterium]
MDFWTQLKAGTVAIGIAMAAVVTPAPASAGTVLKVAESDWTSGAITCRMIEFIIRGWSYKVQRINMASGPAVMESVRAGETQYSCEAWPSYTPAKNRFIKKFGGDGSVAYLGEVGTAGRSGYYVPRYVLSGDKKRKIKARASKLKSWKDLNKFRKVFSTKSTGTKGRLLGCPVAEWNCKDAERLIGLRLDYYAESLGSAEQHWAKVREAYKRGVPFLAYAWEPHWIHAELDLVEVKLPQYSDAAWPATGWFVDVPFNFANPNFVENHPKVARLIENMRLSNEEQSRMIHEIEVKKRKLDDVVTEWLAANEAVWKKWVPADS